jgi:hypothetical protein
MPSDASLLRRRRWRTQYEWAALRLQGAQLGERDTTERAAFYKYRFLFASYAVHAWFWEAIDLFHKLFLTSLISFVAPRSSTQVIGASAQHVSSSCHVTLRLTPRHHVISGVHVRLRHGAAHHPAEALPRAGQQPAGVALHGQQ